MQNPIALHPSIAVLLDTLQLGEPCVRDGLALWPVLGPACAEPVYLTLADVQGNPEFRVTEVSLGGSVPELLVSNGTGHMVLLFDGEELRGAKQNRVLNTSILVPSGGEWKVPVSCTERGRWSYDSPLFAPSGSMAHHELRKRKAAAVDLSLEQGMVHASDQCAVWEEIEQLHCCANSDQKSTTRAMKDAFDEKQRELDEFARGVACQPGQCGLLAVVGERVEGLDVISRPEAYARLHGRLVESHAMDFLVRKAGKPRKAADPAAPSRFLAEAGKAVSSVFPSPGVGDDHRLKFRWGHGSALLFETTVVHLALFGGRGGRDSSAMPPLRRGRRNLVIE